MYSITIDILIIIEIDNVNLLSYLHISNNATEYRFFTNFLENVHETSFQNTKKFGGVDL